MSSKRFVFDWEIPWDKFETLSPTNQDHYSYPFTTSRNGISYQWRASMEAFIHQDSHFGLYLEFMGGCTDTVDAVAWVVQILNGGRSVKTMMRMNAEKYLVPGDNNWGWEKCDLLSKGALQNKYKLHPSESLNLRFTLNIPDKAFEYRVEFPAVDVAPEWMLQQYNNIDKPPSVENYIFSDIKVESNDGVIFYVQKNVVQCQSKPLAVIIQRHGAETNTCIKFPALDKVALRALLRFLHVALVDSADLPTEAVIQLLDAAEQYDLPMLKKICIAALWKRVDDKCKDMPEIIKAADTYKLKGLKCHAICVMADNYEEMHAVVDLQKMSFSLYHWIASYFDSRGLCRIMP